MAQHGPASSPVQLLQDTCQQVQAQAQAETGGYPGMAEGFSMTPQDVFVSRSMMPMPVEPLSRASSTASQPHFANAQMFRGVPTTFLCDVCAQAFS